MGWVWMVAVIPTWIPGYDLSCPCPICDGLLVLILIFSLDN